MGHTDDMRIPVPRPRSLAAQLFAMQAVLIAVVVAGYALFTYVSDRGQAESAARDQARVVARAVADSPSVREAIGTADPTAELQPYALRVMADTEVDFVTIMSPQGIRWTHPDQKQIGKHFLGNTERALKGRTFTETYKGTLGYSVRAVTPVKDGQGRVIGLVSSRHTGREDQQAGAGPADRAARRRGQRARARRRRHVRHQRQAAPATPTA